MTDKVDNAGEAAEALASLLRDIRRNIELDLRVFMPARVVTYDPTLQKATVRLEMLPIRYVDDEEIPDIPIVLPAVPVMWPRSSTGYVTFPLIANDTGRVVFSDRALSLWLATGNPVAPIDPINGRTHSLADGVFEPGLHVDSDPIVPATDLTATVVEGPIVKLGRGATLQVAIASLLHTYLTAWVTAAAVAPFDGGAAFKANLIAYLGANPFTAYAATKVQAQ